MSIRNTMTDMSVNPVCRITDGRIDGGRLPVTVGAKEKKKLGELIGKSVKKY